MTWATRILHLLLIWLLAGPLALPGWTRVASETRVGGSPVFSCTSTSPHLSQPVDSCRENPVSDYDFASGVHKYLYCHDNPVNGVDPSGHETLVSINASIGLMTQMATHELRGANAVLKGARTMFGADDTMNNIIFGLDVINILDEKVGQVALGSGAVVGSLRLYSWIRNTVGSPSVAKGVLESLGRIARMFPSKVPKEIEPVSSPYLYRVIFPKSQDYSKFAGVGTTGSITPRGGHNDVMRHLLADTDSVFTSWSKEPQGNWSRWSAPGAIQVRVDTRRLQNPGLDVTGLAGSDEFLIIGEVVGVERTR